MSGPSWTQPRSARARNDIKKYLLDSEEVPVITRRHWAVLIEPTVKAIPVFLAGGWLFVLDPGNHLTSFVGLLVVLAALIYYGLRVAEWWMRHFIVTSRRVLLTSGVLVRTVTLLPLRRITDLTWQETLFGQLLGYGSFRFESAGQDQALRHLTYLPDAGSLYHEVSALLFGKDLAGPASVGDDDGDGDIEAGDDLPPTSRPVGPAGHDTRPIPDPAPPQG
jgi:membrane protein YdbS with pleckstrin-like domain